MIKIYGHSDDVIEIESDDQTLFKSEEFNVYLNGKKFFAISDGTLLSIEMNRFGKWHIEILFQGTEYLGVEIWKGNDGTDIAYINGYPKWIGLISEENVLGKDGFSIY